MSDEKQYLKRKKVKSLVLMKTSLDVKLPFLEWVKGWWGGWVRGGG